MNLRILRSPVQGCGPPDVVHGPWISGLAPSVVYGCGLSGAVHGPNAVKLDSLVYGFVMLVPRSQVCFHTIVYCVCHLCWHLPLLHPIHQKLGQVSGANLVLLRL